MSWDQVCRPYDAGLAVTRFTTNKMFGIDQREVLHLLFPSSILPFFGSCTQVGKASGVVSARGCDDVAQSSHHQLATLLLDQLPLLCVGRHALGVCIASSWTITGWWRDRMGLP